MFVTDEENYGEIVGIFSVNNVLFVAVKYLDTSRNFNDMLYLPHAARFKRREIVSIENTEDLRCQPAIILENDYNQIVAKLPNYFEGS